MDNDRLPAVLAMRGGSRFLGPALAFAMVLLAAAVTQVNAAQEQKPPALDPTLSAYASAKHSVRLPDGRTIHLVCMGHGSPAVVLSAGAGAWSVAWNAVQPAVARHTRVCAWDRPAYGFSDASRKAQTVDNTTSDLEAALRIGGIAAPYIVVGHSLGAYESIMLADRQRSNVVGMVLVDPSIPNQTARIARVAPAISKWGNEPNPAIAYLEKCAAALRAGQIRRGGSDKDGCLQPQRWPPTYPPNLRTALDNRHDSASIETVAARMVTYASYLKSMDEDTRIVIKSDRMYDDIPLIVLTAGDFPIPPDFSPAAKAEVPTFQADWKRAHDEYAALSSRGLNRIVSGSSHDIPHLKPQVVIDAINEVVSQVRAARKRPLR